MIQQINKKQTEFYGKSETSEENITLTVTICEENLAFKNIIINYKNKTTNVSFNMYLQWESFIMLFKIMIQVHDYLREYYSSYREKFGETK